MSEKYFENFPTISYGGMIVPNITEKASFSVSSLRNPLLYYPYVTNDNERADNIADKQYDDPYLSWIIYLTNQIDDPHYGLGLDQTSFDNLMVKKYGSLKNAVEKTKFYRSNWASDMNVKTETFYNALAADVKHFYEPIYSDVTYSTGLLGYRRKQEDLTVSTNQIVSFSVSGSGFITDEIVETLSSPSSSVIATSQVAFANSSTLVVQHINGSVANSYVRGRESNTLLSVSSTTIVANCIPSTEISYFEPVTYYDWELEQNTEKRNIRLLKRSFVQDTIEQLKEVLK